MEENHPNLSDSRTNSNSPGSKPRNPALPFFAGAVALVAMLGIYSIYVALHEPDRQETIVLGQTKMAAGSPAALRILVRDRVSGKPISGALVELSLRNKSANIKLGAF